MQTEILTRTPRETDSTIERSARTTLHNAPAQCASTNQANILIHVRRERLAPGVSVLPVPPRPASAPCARFPWRR